MSELKLLNYLRNLTEALNGAEEVSDTTLDALEDLQATLDAKYGDYEDTPAPRGGETLRELMMEAYRLMHDGVEEYLLFSEDFHTDRLEQGLAMVEEGHDIMEAVRYAIAQDANWTSAAALC